MILSIVMYENEEEGSGLLSSFVLAIGRCSNNVFI